jgi:hypothetical protein
MGNPHKNDKDTIGACKAFSLRIVKEEREKQPPAAPEKDGK